MSHMLEDAQSIINYRVRDPPVSFYLIIPKSWLNFKMLVGPHTMMLLSGT